MLDALIKGPEAHQRSIVKGVSWRIIGTLDTMLWSWLITHKPITSAMIGGTEIFTKVFLFYIHERLWHLLPVGRDAHWRSFIKAVTWRVVGSLDTFILALIFTGSGKFAVQIATAEALTKIVLYYLHERAWKLVSWGKVPDVDKAAAAPAT